MRERLTLGSLFDGIGGFPMPAKEYGIIPIWASEIEPLPIAVTKERFPEMKHLGDIRTLSGNELEPTDIISGGSPCQDLSVAGKRQGLCGKKSNLFMEMIRIIKEVRKNEKNKGRKNEEIKPRILFWENVPGVFSSNHREDFRIILEEICKIADESIVIPRPAKNKWTPSGVIMGENFSLAWRVFDARYWGVAQRRKRVYLIADFGGKSAPEILFECDGLRGNTLQSKNEWKNSAERIGSSTENSSRNNLRVLPFDTAHLMRSGSGSNPKFDNPCHTLEAQGHVPKVVIQNNCYCISGNAINRKLENGPNGKGVSENTSYTLNATDRHAVYFMGSGQGKAEILKDLSPTVTASAGTSGNNKPIILDMTHPQEVIRNCGELSPTLKTRMGTGGNQVPLVMNNSCNDKDVTYTIGYPAFNCGFNAKYGFDAGENDTTTTLVAKGPNAVYNSKNFSQIRRLTPLECERLQGFPDYWTILTPQDDFSDEEFEFWKKIYLNSHKKEPSKSQLLTWKNKLSSDSARYKALGNSVAIPCVKYVMKRISEAL